MKKFSKFIFSLVLIAMLAMSFGCSNVSKNNSSSNQSTSNDASNESSDLPILLLENASISQETRLAQMKAEALKKNNGYLDTDKVSAIIKLDDESLVDLYSNDVTSCRSVLDYANSSKGIKAVKNILSEQNSLIEKLEAKGYVDKVKYQYNTVINAIAVETTYGNLKKIEGLNGVSQTILSETYNLPKTTTTEGYDAVENVVDVYETGIFNSSSVNFNGEGTAVAILDSGFDISHSVFQQESIPSNPLLDESDVLNVLNKTNAYSQTQGLLVSDVYKNTKVPFAYDYADSDFEVEPTDSNHGTHVAGIIGGKDDTITGVAIHTQLVLMKVFSDTYDGAETEDLLAALEDSVLLGVDAINMSLGTSCGFSREADSSAINEVYDAINNSGISLIVAASNSYSSGFGGENSNTNKVTNPDSSTVGSPSTYYGALSVASISGTKSNYIVGPDDYVFFFTESNSNSGKANDFYEDLNVADGGDVVYEYVTVPGDGLRINYSNINVKGKIALVKRGNNTFEEKAMIAQSKGAIACIIYNNVPGDISMSMGKLQGFPTISISKDDGEKLAEHSTGELIFNTEFKAGPFMSDFSSWGPTADLKLKPEITAHGGNITSAVPGGGYDQLSGTSMACPNMCGVVVLIRQYLKEKYPNYSYKQISDLAYQLLMSTATIALNEEGNPYSPRKQGAGLASLKDVVETPAYLTVDDNPGNGLDASNRPKLELGDDKNRSGVYEMVFNIYNVSNTALTYNISVLGMTESVSTSDKDYVAEMSYMLNGMTNVSAVSNCVVNGSKVTVEAGSKATVKVVYTLTVGDKNYIDSSFPYGMYVEGYVVLTPEDGTTIDLNAPFLAFYGDWTEAPLFDKTFYEVESEAYDQAIDDEDKLKADYYATTPFGSYYSNYVISLGTYVYEMDLTQYDQIPASEDKIAISSTTGTLDGINCVYGGLLRGAKEMIFTITDTVTGEVIYSHTDYNANKAYSNGGSPMPYYEELKIKATDLNLVNNRKYHFSMQGLLDYGDGGIDTNARNKFEFDFYMDDEAPLLKSAVYEKEYDKTLKKDRYYVTLTVYDNHYVQSITPIAFKGNDEYVVLSQYPIPVYGERGQDATVRIEITDYLEDLAFDDVTNNCLSFAIDDYALNSNIYLCSLPGTKGNLKFTDDGTSTGANKTTVKVDEGSMVDLVQYLTSSDTQLDQDKDYLQYLTWSSSNESVAIVENGQVIGLKPGSATITVSNPTFSVQSASISVRVVSPTKTNVPVMDNASLEKIEFTYFDVVSAHAPSGEYTVIGEENGRKFFDSLPKGSDGTAQIDMYPGEQIQLNYAIYPWYLPSDRYTLKYSSTNTQIATVDENGLVTTKKKGACTIKLNITIDGRESNMMALLYINVLSEFIIENRVLVAYKGVGGDVVIPDDEGITAISSYAFCLYEIDRNIPIDEYHMDANKIPQTNSTITSVVVPEGVEDIQKYAFYNCENLTSVTLPESIKYVRDYAFYNDQKLTSINLENVEVIGSNAFKNCTSLTSVDLSEIYSISYNAFENSGLITVDISTLRSSGIEIFKNCKNLTSVVMNKDTKLSKGMFENSGLTDIEILQDRIPENCFKGCSSLLQATISNDIVYLGSSVFADCTNLNSINILGKVQYIYNNAFSNCTSLTSFKMPNSSFTLGDYAFSDCTNLETIIFEDDAYMTSIGKNVFDNTSLSTFVTTNSNKYMTTAESSGVLYDKDGANIVLVALNANSEIVIPETVEVIGSGAFSGLKNLTKITITNPNTVIDTNAFANCIYLETVVLPENNNVVINDYAFYNNQSLREITNLNYVKKIGAYAFTSTALTDVTISDSAVVGNNAFQSSAIATLTLGSNTILGNNSFDGCSNLSVVNMPANGNVTILDGVFANDTKLTTIDLTKTSDTIGEKAFYGCRSLTDINLANVKYIKSYAFAECSNLTNVNMPLVIEIGSGAFSKIDDNKTANKITQITLPSTLKVLGASAFKDSVYLTSLELPNGLSEIKANAFNGCTALTSVVLPQSVKLVGESAFKNCTALESINLNNVEDISSEAFLGCKKLTTIDLSSTLTIGYGAFASSGINSISNSDLVQTIEGYAFQGATFDSVSFKSLSYLGDGAFSNCSNLVSFAFSDSISYIGKTAFYGANDLTDFLFYNGNEAIDTATINEYALVDNGILYTYMQNGNLLLTAVPANKDMDVLSVLENTYAIDVYAGNQNKYISEIILPDTLSSIANFAFYGYKALKKVEFRSFTAPQLESFFVDGGELTYTDPGYELFNYAYHLFTNEYGYYQFVDKLGKNEALTLVLPANDGVIGYDSIIYEGFFGDIANATHSDYVAKDNYTLAFLEIIDSVPMVDNVTLKDEEVITNAVTILNSMKQSLTQFGYTQQQADEMTNKVIDAKYKLYAIKLSTASQAAQDLQVELNNLDTTFKLENLSMLQDIASRYNSLQASERSILDLRNYEKLLSSYNDYLISLNQEGNAVDELANNAFAFKLLIEVVSATGLMGALLFMKKHLF